MYAKSRESRLQPAILRRKRKADSELEPPSPPSSPTTDRFSSNLRTPRTDASDESSEDITSPSAAQNCRESFRPSSCLPTPEIESRLSPLPNFSWANPKDVWQLMLHKDATYLRNPQLMGRHPSLHARMRSILLDWLMEVCEVYKLHRDTFYLAQDFIDRYLATRVDVPKQQLQLLGITCLFIAAKIEEIYPPKLAEFAYVTDEACTEGEIVEKELVVLKILNWDLTPLTVVSWVNVYLQLAASTKRLLHSSDNFIFPEYSPNIFVHVSQLLDLCILDINSLQFSYSVLAASAFYHITSERIALKASGFSISNISNCVTWMAPYSETMKEKGFFQVKSFPKGTEEEHKNTQTHVVSLSLLEEAQSRKPDVSKAKPSNNVPCHLLSTPRSCKKPPRSLKLQHSSPSSDVP